MTQPVMYGQAVEAIAAAAAKIRTLLANEPVVICDLGGRLHVAVNMNRANISAEVVALLTAALANAGNHAAMGNTGLLARDDLYDPDAVFSNPDIGTYRQTIDSPSVLMLDRSIGGQDWLRSSQVERAGSRIPRLVFYGIKGGVGRSTAVAMCAYDLASAGKKVLVVDLDLESPGLAGLLLGDDPMLDNHRMPDFGLIDWFAEDAVGQGNALINRMTAESPLSAGMAGTILVAPSAGRDDPHYVAKLSRVYGDVPEEDGPAGFGQRVGKLLAALEASVKPDVVLLDSRAGIHDIAAASIVRYADWTLLFAADTASTWQAYRMLFQHWSRHPAVATEVRWRLAMVQSMLPESDQVARAQRFLERSYDLFRDTLYDEIVAESGAPHLDQPRGGSYDLKDEDAPHYPRRIKWSARFQEFDTALIRAGIVDRADIDAAFGPVLGMVRSFAGLGAESDES